MSKDKGVLRAAEESDHFVAIDSLDRLLALVAWAEDHDMADTVSAAFEEQTLLKELQETLSENMGEVGSLYDGDREEGEVLALELVELEEIEDVIILRIDKDHVACVAHVRLSVTAEIGYTDFSEAIWDGEDKRYFGGKSVVTEIEDSVECKVFVDLAREGDEISFSSAQFLTQDLTVTDFGCPFYLLHRPSQRRLGIPEWTG